MKDKTVWFFLGGVAAIILILWLGVSFKCLMLAIALTGLGLYIHITITTLTNLTVLDKKDVVDLTTDNLWKIICLITAIIGFSIYFNI